MAIVPDASKRIDEAFNKAPKFAQPICKKLRQIIHKADPQIVEDWKWGPNFNHNGMVCGIWYFKNHVTLTFFQGASMKDVKKQFEQEDVPSARNRNIKFRSMDDINDKALIAYIKEAVEINLKGKIKPDRTISIPADLNTLLKKEKLLQYFESLAYTHRKEYIRWIEDSKRVETRKARLNKALEMIKEKKKL